MLTVLLGNTFFSSNYKILKIKNYCDWILQKNRHANLKLLEVLETFTWSDTIEEAIKSLLISANELVIQAYFSSRRK